LEVAGCEETTSVEII
jgi:hypothetical protein